MKKKYLLLVYILMLFIGMALYSCEGEEILDGTPEGYLSIDLN